MSASHMILTISGHRPKFLPCLYNENHKWCLDLKARIAGFYEENKPSVIISGMALGMDIWAAEIALEKNIDVWAYVPFKGQGDNWPLKDKDRYERVCLRAKKVHLTSTSYSKQAFFIRDEAMVDDGTEVLALWNPEIQSGGTHHTIQYAKQKGKEVINLWEK